MTVSPRKSRRQDPTENLPPAAVEAEQACLGCVFYSRTAAETVVRILRRQDFYTEGHRRIFDAIAFLLTREEETALDTLTVAEELRRREQLDAIGGPAYLYSLLETVPTAAHVEHYVGIVLRASVERQVLEVRDEIPEILESAADPDSAIAAVEDRLEEVRNRGNAQTRRVFSAPGLVAEDLPEPAWTVPGVLSQGVYLLVGRAKQGKSWLAYQLSIAVASGGMALGAIPVDRGKVLYLALEDTKRRLKKRLLKLLAEGEAAPEWLHFATTWKRSDDGGALELDAWCRRNPEAKLIVIDVFGKFRKVREKSGAGIYLDDYHDISAVKAVADRRGITALLIHHQNKGKDLQDIADSFSGSTGLAAAVDGWLVLKRERGQPLARLEIDSRDHEEPWEAALEFDPRTIWTLRGEAAEYIRTREEDEVLQLLAPTNASITPKQLGEKLEISRDAAQKRLARMEDRKMLVSEAGGYRLSPVILARYAENGGFGVGAVRPVRPVRAVGGVPLSELTPDLGHPPGGNGAGTPPSADTADTPDASDTRDSADASDTSDMERAFSDLPLPPETDPAEIDLRQRCYRLAAVRGFPALVVAGTRFEAGEEAWAAVCRIWHAGLIAAAVEGLSGMGGTS